MYDLIHTENDLLRERFIYGAEFDGEFDFPILPKISADEISENLKSVPFNLAKNEKNPKKAICHFYLDDAKFEKVWNFPEKYFPILRNFKFVISSDFSAYDQMPKALQIYQYYRDRALAWEMVKSGINVIPNCGFGGKASWEFCFDGLPKESVLAVTTNGRTGKSERKHFIDGFLEMERRLNPVLVICVGKPIEFEAKTKIIFLDSFAQQWKERMEKIDG